MGTNGTRHNILWMLPNANFTIKYYATNKCEYEFIATRKEMKLIETKRLINKTVFPFCDEFALAFFS